MVILPFLKGGDRSSGEGFRFNQIESCNVIKWVPAYALESYGEAKGGWENI